MLGSDEGMLLGVTVGVVGLGTEVLELAGDEIRFVFTVFLTTGDPTSLDTFAEIIYIKCFINTDDLINEIVLNINFNILF